MPLDTSKQLELTPIEIGSMVEVPPDLPDGAWTGTCTVRDGVAEEGGQKYLRLFLEWTALEAVDAANESYVGGSATHMITFYPKDHRNNKFVRSEVKKLCDAFDIAEPDTSSVEEDGKVDSLVPFVEVLEEGQRPFWTVNRLDKNGVNRTNVLYQEPGKKLELAPPEVEEKPKTVAKAKKGKR
jgi:hypothetical protein